MAGHDNHGKYRPLALHTLQQFDAVQAGHADVGDDASGSDPRENLEEARRGGEAFDGKAGGATVVRDIACRSANRAAWLPTRGRRWRKADGCWRWRSCKE